MTKETISRYLENGCKGHKNVVSSRELERALGISGNELRRHINRLRRGTVPIAADQRGYYYAETAAEVYATIRSLEKIPICRNCTLIVPLKWRQIYATER